MKFAVMSCLFLVVLAGCASPEPAPAKDHGADPHHEMGASGMGGGTLALTGAEDVVMAVSGGSLAEFRYAPDRIAVASGQRVGIVFTNDGTTAHEFSINDVEFHLHVQNGESKSGAFIAPGPGEYVFGCYIPGHFEAGMRGVLVVA